MRRSLRDGRRPGQSTACRRLALGASWMEQRRPKAAAKLSPPPYTYHPGSTPVMTDRLNPLYKFSTAPLRPATATRLNPLMCRYPAGEQRPRRLLLPKHPAAVPNRRKALPANARAENVGADDAVADPLAILLPTADKPHTQPAKTGKLLTSTDGGEQTGLTADAGRVIRMKLMNGDLIDPVELQHLLQTDLLYSAIPAALKSSKEAARVARAAHAEPAIDHGLLHLRLLRGELVRPSAIEASNFHR